MVTGISKFLDGQAEKAIAERPARWACDFSSREAYEKIGAANAGPVGEDDWGGGAAGVACGDAVGFHHRSHQLARPQFRRKDKRGELAGGGGDLCGGHPRFARQGHAPGGVVVIPDADESPEKLSPTFWNASRRRVARSSFPTLVNREVTYSGSERTGRWTNQPHREWIYRQGFDLGRHIIGYEVQEILAAVDRFAAQFKDPAAIGCIGYGEGLLALYAAALDPRIDATLVSGYFAPRNDRWREPVYRNVFGFARDFGDAELATLIAPRRLVI